MIRADSISRDSNRRLPLPSRHFLPKMQDRNQFLSNINEKGQVRRSTKLEILGKVRVMSYEDLENGMSGACCERGRERGQEEGDRVQRESLPRTGENVVGSARARKKQVRQSQRSKLRG